jgi:hypothetical protein
MAKYYDTYKYTHPAQKDNYGWDVQVTAMNDEGTQWQVTRRRHGYEHEVIAEFSCLPHPQKSLVSKKAKELLRAFIAKMHHDTKHIKFIGYNQFMDDKEWDALGNHDKLKEQINEVGR